MVGRIAILIVFLTTVLFEAFPINASPSKQCLQCICEASSGCKSNIRCHNTGSGQYFCGPYQISWAYWADAGKPGSNGFSNDFENCLVDRNCAEAAVRGYMSKYGNVDCIGPNDIPDSEISCFDYAAIHKTGPGGCNQRWLLNSKYWREFKQCYTGSNSGGGGGGTNGAISFRPLAPLSDSVSSSFPSSTSTLRSGSSSGRTIIEIAKPLSPLSRPGGLSHSSAISSSSPSFGSGFTSFSTSSSFSRHNFTHSEVEVTESVAANSNSILSANRVPYLPRGIPLNTAFTSVPQSAPFKPKPLPSLPAPIPLPTLPVNRPVNSHPTVLQTFPKPKANFKLIVGLNCLECLCQASSNCNHVGCCNNKGCEGAYCGPYLLSWGYWADGGQPGNGANYLSCANNRTCAELAVQGYMNKWNKDCNGDGRITCDDFALIHKLGPHACDKVEAIKVTDYWKHYSTCQSSRLEEIDERSPEVPNRISSENTNSFLETRASRFIGPLKPSESEVEEAPRPTLVGQPLSPRSSHISSGSDVRVSFNNGEIVNRHRPSSLSENSPNRQLPPAMHGPLPASPENSVNLNVISNSPLSRPTFSSSSLSPLVNEPSIVQPRSHSPLPLKPSTTEVPFKEVSTSLNDNFFSNPRPNDSPIAVPLPPPFLSDNSPSEPSARLTESNFPQPQPINTLINSTSNSFVGQDCLECICHASSRCNNGAGCVSDGAGKFICGPFQVDWEYWTEAGKPGMRPDLSNLENFQQCLTNRQCANEAVNGYMKKFKKDCNEDGAVDCNDFAAIHIAGPKSCNAKWYLDSQYYSDFRSCYDFKR